MSDATRKEYQQINDKIAEMDAIFQRMDTDEGIYLLDPYKMKQLPPRESQEVQDVANVTLNDPLLYATKAIAIIGGATRQAVIEGNNLPDKKTTKIEEFLDDVFYMVNEQLMKRKGVGLDAFINEQICIRGRIAARSCVRLNKEGRFVADVTCPDSRYFVCESDADGMNWGASVFTRTKSQIEKEYSEELGSQAITLSAENEVRDYWNDTRNIVFIGQNILKEEENPYGYPPFINSICPIGSSFGTEDAWEHQGESIFWPNRDLWDEMNRCATILQTLNVNSLFGALQYESAHGEAMPKPGQSPWKPRTVHGVEKGGGYKPMPIADIKNATRLFYSMLEGRLQRGSLSAIDYGNLTFPLSAIAITTLSGSRDDIFLPRIQAIAMFYQALSRMIISQCKQIGKTVYLGESGKENPYTKADLEGDYTIKYRFFTQTKEQSAADLSIAAAARGLLPDDYIRREIIKVQDPDGLQTQLESEQAEKIDEALFLARKAVKLCEDAENYSGFERELKESEAFILVQRIKDIAKQRKLQSASAGKVEGARPQENVQPGEKPEPAVPLLPTGQGTRRPTPQEEVKGE